MTAEQRKSVLDLVGGRISDEEFLRRFNIARVDASKLSLRVLDDAYDRRDPDDVEFGLLIGFHFGFSPEHVDILCRLSDAEWHTQHENVILALDELSDQRAVGCFYRAALKLHPYLDYDEFRALAVKAIWALGKVQDSAADEKLRLLAESDQVIVRDEAQNQLRRRQGVAPIHKQTLPVAKSETDG